MTRVVCMGLATRDTIWLVPEHPAEDGRVVASELVVAGGGPAATAAVTLARLGAEVAFAGAVGDDDAGAFVRDGLAGEGVDVSLLAVVAGARTAQSAILVGPAGTRTIVHHPGTAQMNGLDRSEWPEWLHVDHVGYGHVRGQTPDMSARPPVAGTGSSVGAAATPTGQASSSHDRGQTPDTATRISVDGGNPIAGLSLEGVALYAPTEAAIAAQFGDAAAAIAAGAGLVVVTRGAEGSVATTHAGDTVEAPGVPCAAPVSTLGAGDVFHGALVAFLARDAPLHEALVAANTAASLSCRALDGRSAIPTLNELERSLT